MDQQELKQRFHQNVKFLCNVKCIPIRELEVKAGMSVGYFSKLKTNEVGLWLAWRIATVLDSDLKELLEDPDEMWRRYRIKILEAELKVLKEGDQKKHEAV